MNSKIKFWSLQGFFVSVLFVMVWFGMQGCDPFPQCSKDDDCAKPLRCHPERRVCEAQCTSQSDCGTNQQCVNLVCVDGSSGQGATGLDPATAKYLAMLKQHVKFEVDPKTQKATKINIAGHLQLDLEAKTIKIGDHLTVESSRVLVSKANLQIVNGMNKTDSSNSTGNVIVGYNEENNRNVTRTGSHSIVVGTGHSYASYGGIVTGKNNSIIGAYSNVCGGEENTAESLASTVSGGQKNKVQGQWASISGGRNNSANGAYASVSGGSYNFADGNYTSVVGGGGIEQLQGNRCQGNYSVIVGGEGNTVSCQACVLLGGQKLNLRDNYEAGLGAKSQGGTCLSKAACQ